eukprot:TRINITY_DN47767_c0_g1_i1.p1 TRINITY_DN47767_c0_g1~~TRINITY_DN47767_c0_g1_i1.p1  ORF type:complete len:316 (+),score=46.62 TRINITY_DN47767_c0_g1_i1:35-982(+)
MASTAPGARKPNVMVHTAAGTAAGLATTLLLYPVDFVRTRIAAQDGTHARTAGQTLRGTFHAFSVVARQDGPRVLYRGASPALLGSSVSWGLFFGINRWLQNIVPSDLSRPARNSICSGIAGLTTTCLTSPLWLVKTRLQLVDRTLPPDLQYKSMTDAFAKIWRKEGAKGLFRGVVPQCLLVSNSVIQYVTYEQLKAVCYATSRIDPKQKLPDTHLLPCIVVSKLIATVTTNPILVVKIRMQDVRNDLAETSVRYRSVATALRTIHEREGYRGLFKGVVPGLLRVIPSAVLTFLSYEHLVQAFDNLHRRMQPLTQ